MDPEQTRAHIGIRAHLTYVLVGVDEPPAKKSSYFIAAEYVPAVCLFLLGHTQTVRVRIVGEDVNGADAVRSLERKIQGAGPLFRVGEINGGEFRVRILLLFHTHCQRRKKNQCCGSTNPDPYLWLTDPDPSRWQLIIFVFQSFFAYNLLKLHLHHLSEIKKSKRSHKTVGIKGFFYYIGLMIDGSGRPKIYRRDPTGRSATLQNINPSLGNTYPKYLHGNRLPARPVPRTDSQHRAWQCRQLEFARLK